MSVTGVKSTVKEPNAPDNDQQVRTLFTDAAGDVPPGIDLLHGFEARQARRRVRGRVALATAAASLLGDRRDDVQRFRDARVGLAPAGQ